MVLEPAHELLALGVPALPVGRVREELDHRVAGEVALVLAQRAGANLVEGLTVEPHGEPGDEGAELLGPVRDGVVGRPRQHLPDPQDCP